MAPLRYHTSNHLLSVKWYARIVVLVPDQDQEYVAYNLSRPHLTHQAYASSPRTYGRRPLCYPVAALWRSRHERGHLLYIRG